MWPKVMAVLFGVSNCAHTVGWSNTMAAIAMEKTRLTDPPGPTRHCAMNFVCQPSIVSGNRKKVLRTLRPNSARRKFLSVSNPRYSGLKLRFSFRSFFVQETRSTFKLSAVVLALLLPGLFPCVGAAADLQTDVVQTSQGPLRITPIFHASVMLEFGGKVIYVDPSRGDFTGLPPADLFLITHTHGDHLDKAVMAKLKKPTTIYMGTSGVIDTVNCHCPEINVVNEGQ